MISGINKYKITLKLNFNTPIHRKFPQENKALLTIKIYKNREIICHTQESAVKINIRIILLKTLDSR